VRADSELTPEQRRAVERADVVVQELADGRFLVFKNQYGPCGVVLPLSALPPPPARHLIVWRLNGTLVHLDGTLVRLFDGSHERTGS